MKSEECPIKKGLTEELLSAHSQLAELNNQDVQCILRGDWAGSEALTGQMIKVRERRERALEAFHRHLIEHGCQAGVMPAGIGGSEVGPLES